MTYHGSIDVSGPIFDHIWFSQSNHWILPPQDQIDLDLYRELSSPKTWRGRCFLKNLIDGLIGIDGCVQMICESVSNHCFWVCDSVKQIPPPTNLRGQWNAHLKCWIYPTYSHTREQLLTHYQLEEGEVVDLDSVWWETSITPQHHPDRLVLLIEDDLPVMCYLVTYLTHRYGCQIEVASDPSTIRQRLRQTRYDLIVADTTIVGTEETVLIAQRNMIPEIIIHNTETPLIITDHDVVKRDGNDYWGVRSLYLERARQLMTGGTGGTTSPPGGRKAYHNLSFLVKKMVIENLIDQYMLLTT